MSPHAVVGVGVANASLTGCAAAGRSCDGGHPPGWGGGKAPAVLRSSPPLRRGKCFLWEAAGASSRAQSPPVSRQLLYPRGTSVRRWSRVTTFQMTVVLTTAASRLLGGKGGPSSVLCSPSSGATVVGNCFGPCLSDGHFWDLSISYAQF